MSQPFDVMLHRAATAPAGVKQPGVASHAAPLAAEESGGKRRYRAFCQAPSPIPLFSRDWWLDALVGPVGWDVALVEQQGEIVGSLPYLLGGRYGFRWSSHPALAQTLGPWIRPSAGKSAKAMAFEKDVLGALADALPAFDHFAQNWHHAQGNWLPFYWRGFSQTTRYTYLFPDLTDEEALWSGLDGTVRNSIRKAESRFGLQVRKDLGVEDFLPLNHMTFDRQALSAPYDDATVRRLDQACQARGCRQIFIAEDAEGRRHAGEYLVWDEHSSYCLMGGSDPALRSSGATSLCLWEAVRFAAGTTRCFDFAGSMLEPVERQFRAFGAERRAYLRIWKTNSKLLRLSLALRGLWRGG